MSSPSAEIQRFQANCGRLRHFFNGALSDSFLFNIVISAAVGAREDIDVKVCPYYSHLYIFDDRFVVKEMQINALGQPLISRLGTEIFTDWGPSESDRDWKEAYRQFADLLSKVNNRMEKLGTTG